MQCPVCKMGYSEENPEDRRLHRIYHDKIVNGVPARPLKSDNVIWRHDKDRIVVVTSFSPIAQRVRAAKVARAANQETQYDFGIYSEHERPDFRDIHLFVYCYRNRSAGLSILERRSNVCHYTWEEFDNRIQKTLEKQVAIWSLGFTWVHKKYRRRGIGKTLLMEAVRYLRVEINEIGLYTPFTNDGESFARYIFREGFLIAK